MKIVGFFRRYPLVAVALVVLAVTLSLVAFGLTGLAQILATTMVLLVVAITTWDMIKDILKGHWGLDILAVVAMVSTVLVGEYVAGLIIVLMLTGGEALEDYAANRAGKELDALISRAPAFANRIGDDGEITRIRVAEVLVGDELIVRPAELVPVDGTLSDAVASIDESSLTGEPLPVEKFREDEVYSGTVNGTLAFTMRATATAADSQYASIVRLVTEAVESKAPMVRLADRYAVPFTFAALVIAAIAWAITGDPVRFAEVLVVATPCPLLIAAPVAFMGGMSRAAKAGVIVKNGGALESLAQARSAAFDKTGTLTRGRAEVRRVVSVADDEETILGLAAAAEQYSVHVFAHAIVDHAKGEGIPFPAIEKAEETATLGVRAVLPDGASIRVGKPSYIAEVTGPHEAVKLEPGETAVYVSRGPLLSGVIIVADPLRPESAATLAALERLGVSNRIMVTGDVPATARAIASAVGITEIFADCTPTSKVRIVADLPRRPVIMVGDGINDAPVLAAAEVGIAMGARGATAASESAAAVITKDDLFVVAKVVDISQRTVSVALQSIWLGILISIGLMFVAAFGYLPAVAGALLQEVVDLVAILGALRALGGRTPEVPVLEPSAARPAVGARG